jgi:hypothetical protein
MTAPFRLTAPEPSEREVHEACAKLLDKVLLDPARWCSYPAGASVLSPQQAARHIRIGLKRGYPDIMIFYGGIYGIELKRRGAKLSKTRIGLTRSGASRIYEGQEDVFPQLLATGAWRDIVICHSTSEVLDQLVAWNIPHHRRAAA